MLCSTLGFLKMFHSKNYQAHGQQKFISVHWSATWPLDGNTHNGIFLLGGDLALSKFFQPLQSWSLHECKGKKDWLAILVP